MKFLLINPPVHDVHPITYQAQPSHLLRIGAYLKSEGHDVKFFDFEPFEKAQAAAADKRHPLKHKPQPTYILKKFGNTTHEIPLNHYGKSYKEFMAYLEKIEKPDEVFITSIMTYHCRGPHEVASLCKKIYPNTKVTIGGIYASLCTEHAKTSEADKIHVGEIPEANICKPAIELLEEPPNYTVIKSRWGCPYKCSYCAVPKLEGRKIRSVPPEAVFQQMKELYHDFGIKSFCLWDSNILINWKRHIGPILDMVLDSGLDMKIDLSYGFQPNLLTPEFSKKMKESGVIDFFQLPIESAEEYLYIERFHRTSTVSDLKRAVDMLKDVGFRRLYFYVLAGMPDQSMESILKSCILAWKLGVGPTVLFFTPINGSEEFAKYEHLIKDKDLEDLNPMLFPFCNTEQELLDNLALNRLGNKKTVDIIENLKKRHIYKLFYKLLEEEGVDLL